MSPLQAKHPRNEMDVDFNNGLLQNMSHCARMENCKDIVHARPLRIRKTAKPEVYMHPCTPEAAIA
jgi:hypothetical protein